MSENYANSSSDIEYNWTNHEREVIQARHLKQSNFIVYARFDNTNIPTYNATNYTHDLRILKPEEFAAKIIKHLNSFKRLENVEKKNNEEGLGSPLRLLSNWNGTVNNPSKPPKHRLLDKVFIGDEVYEDVLKYFIDGGKRSGITGFVGMGGVGKTYTAQKICWELINNHEWEIVYVSLLQQSTDEALDALIAQFELYFVLNLNTDRKILAIQKFFDEARRKFDKLLVVLDNAENFPNLPLLLQAIGDTPILVTSRQRECDDTIKYHRLNSFTGDNAIKYCGQLLFNHQISDDKNDIQCLKRLCEALGGHPLGIKLAITNFANNDMAMSKKERFCTLLTLLKKNGIGNLKIITPSGNIDNDKLHKTIKSTFEWTYIDLASGEKNLNEQLAYILLPILSILGTSRITLDVCEKAIEFLVNSDAEDSLPWKKTLKAISDDSIELAINKLSRMSLLEILDDGSGSVYSIHPLIREFSLEHLKNNSIQKEYPTNEDNKSSLMPTSYQVYHMALNILFNKESLEEHNISTLETIVDIIQRIRDDKQLLVIAIELFKSFYDQLFFSRNSWISLKNILEIIHEANTHLNIKEHISWVNFHLGELKDRMGYEDGIGIIKEEIKILIQESHPRFNNMEFDTVCDLAINKNEHELIWPSLYAKTYKKDDVIDRNTFIHIAQIIRMLSNQNDEYNIGRLLSDYGSIVTHNLPDEYQTALSAKNQSLASNVVLDLVQIYQLQIRNYQSTAITEDLFNRAINNPLSYVTNGNAIYYKLSKTIELYRFGLIESKEFKREIETLKAELLQNGIRGFKLESQYCRALAEKKIENNNYEDVAVLLERSNRSLYNYDKEYNMWIIDNKLLKILSQLLSGEDNNLESIRENFYEFIREAKQYLCNEVIPLKYLIEMQLEDNIQSKEKFRKQSIKAFYKYLGHIPPYASGLLRGNQNTLDMVSIENWIDWQVNYGELPNRVRSKLDGRTMRLVKHGLQTDIYGKEIWLYPFYIDEEPLDIETLKNNLTDEYELINNKLDAKIVSIDENTVQKISTQVGKKIPSSTELFSAYLQLQENIDSKRWSSVEEAIQEMLLKATYVLDNNSAYRKELKYVMDMNKEYIGRKQLPFGDLDEFYLFKWVKNHRLFKERYNTYVLSRLKSTPLSSRKQNQFATLIMTSLSLDNQEKLRVLEHADEMTGGGLSEFQCDELIKVLQEEKEKFKELLEEHPDNVDKLIQKAYDDFLSICKIAEVNRVVKYDKWFCYTGIANTDLWINREKQNPIIHTSYIGNKASEKDILPVVRYVVPIFTKEDLNNLETIDVAGK